VGVDKATNSGEIDQPPLAPYARKTASEKQDQEKGKGRAMKEQTNERSTRTEKMKGKGQKRSTHCRKQSKNRHHTPSPTPRPTLRSEHLRSASSLPPKPRLPDTEQTQDSTSTSQEGRKTVPIPRTPRTRAKHRKEPFPNEIWPGVMEHRKHMFSKRHDPMSWGNRRSKSIALLNQQSTTTQDKLLTCIRELQKPGTAYTPAPLIQQIPHLIRYRKGDPADTHELLIALINDISEPISQIFQGQMASTVQCSHCNKATTKTDNTQDISLHIKKDSSTALEEKLYNFFQQEMLEGENAYWCDTFQKSCRATKTLSYTHIPTILIVHLKRLILGKKIQNYIPFGTA